MADFKTKIHHKGLVKSINTDSMVVSIMNASACSGCHAKGACGLSDIKEKEIEINNISEEYHLGEMVNVSFEEHNGFKALFYGYMLPFLLVLAVLLLLSMLQQSEIVVGISSLFVVVPYYIILYFFRDTIKQKFNFQVEKINKL